MHLNTIVTLWVSLLSFIVLVVSQGDDLQSISALADYSSLRGCATGCFYAFSSADRVGTKLRCKTISDLAQNDCYCRTDLQGSAESYLSSCVSYHCDGNPSDMRSAASLYESYCTANGFSVSGPADAEASPTDSDADASPTATGTSSGPTNTSGGSGVTSSASDLATPRTVCLFLASFMTFLSTAWL